MNHSLDSSTQRFTEYDGFIQLTNGDYLTITLKKPQDNSKYILEADPKVIEYEKKKYEDDKREKMVDHMMSSKKQRTSRIPPALLNGDDPQLLTGEFEDIENEDILEYDVKKSKEYALVSSSSSFHFDDVESFVYGPTTSRFWMLRK